MGVSRIAGRYELQEQLGEGGMGVVWRALDSKTGSSVAIKLMKDATDPVAVELFTKEWKALAEISHPNIVEIRDVDVIEENRQKKPFFVMPLLRGCTLAELISNASTRLTLDRVVEITSHVCRGLQAAHQCGLVHRDLKPSNIFVMEDDTAKIIDFGVVHLAGSKSVTGQKGTFQYMSPEQAQLKEITPASDLFSMGVILYEALTRCKPFSRKTADETIEAVVKYIPPPVSEINPSVNQSVSKVVHKCLAKQPMYRFANARELAEMLKRAARNEEVFDRSKIEPRIARAKEAFKKGDLDFAHEILAELEAEGNLDPHITLLRMQIDMASKERKIQQLLVSARARLEQDEIALALDKIREALELDPKNDEALKMRMVIEKQRSEREISRWLELAQTHLANRDFGAARNAVQEVLTIRSADPHALDLLEKIESTEADAKRIREQKEQLYNSALRAYQNGGIESALSKLERLLSVAQENPSAAIPERDAVYQSFYKEVRSERETFRAAFEDAQRQLSEKNFAGAMAVAHELESKYPNDGTIKALKIRIEDAERQEMSSYTAEVAKRLEGEPDLERRVNVMREACERYPNDMQFAQQYKAVRERRDLVNSIVAKAHQFEERGQYTEAMYQWDTVLKIHPEYPGIAFEIEHCKKKRDLQVREEERSRLVQEIDGLLQTRAYPKAIEFANAALVEFPNDAELQGMKSLAEQGLERTRESRHLFDDGQKALAEGDLVRAAELFRSSLNLDPRSQASRGALITALTERGQALVGEDHLTDAEPLCQEAQDLDGTNAAVRALRQNLSEGKRKTFVGQTLTECKAMVEAGQLQPARERIRAARGKYPNDSRLEQYELLLRKEEKNRDLDELREDVKIAEHDTDTASLHAVRDRVRAIRDRHPDDAEINQRADAVETCVNTKLLPTGSISAPVANESVRSTPVREEKKAPVAVPDDAKTRLYTGPTPQPKPQLKPTPKPDRIGPILTGAAAFGKGTTEKAIGFFRPAGKLSVARLGVLSGLLVLIAGGVFVATHRPGTTPEKPPKPVQMVAITTNPADAAITAGGQPITNGQVEQGTTIQVSKLGYKTKQVPIQSDADGQITLEPEQAHLSIHTSDTAGTIKLDGQQIGDLSDGPLDQDLTPDANPHSLVVSAPGKPAVSLQIQIPAGGQPSISGLSAKDVFVITSLGYKATIYGGSQIRFQLGDQSVTPDGAGTQLQVSDQSHTLTYTNGTDQGSVDIPVLNAPNLTLQSLNAMGQVFVTSKVENATLTVDGLSVPRGKRGWTVSKPPGKAHTFAMSAEGYEPAYLSITFQRGQALTKDMEPTPRPKATMVDLVITGGTPGARVELDGVEVGELDASGAYRRPRALNEGKHRVVLLKPPDLVSRPFENLVKPPSDWVITDAKLSQTNRILAFTSDAKNFSVKYRRDGDAAFTQTVGDRVAVPPGTYEVIATAPGYQELGTRVTIGKDNVTVPLKFNTLTGFEFEDANLVTPKDQWFVAKTKGKFIPLKAGLLHMQLIFNNPGKKWLLEKKIEWMVELPQRPAQVKYTLEGHTLLRKVVINNVESDQRRTPDVDLQSSTEKGLISLRVRVDGARIEIVNDRGTVVDQIVAPQDFSGGRINVKTDSEFLPRREQ